MNILVCIKQVPDLEGVVFGNGSEPGAAPAFFGEFRMNRFDEFAVEQALCIKELMAGVRIDAITVGPERAAAVLKRAMGMGADTGVHLQTTTEDDSPPAVAAARIAAWARTGNYTLILCGTMSEDGMHGQVGPMAAALLDLPYATQVIVMQPSRDGNAMSIEREIESGARQMLDIRLPALLAVQPGINRPRYPSLSNLLRANRQVLTTIPVEAPAPGAVSMDCVGMVRPERRRGSQVMTGSARDKALQLATILKAKAFLL